VFKRSKEQEKKGSEKREDLLVSFLKDAHFVFAIILIHYFFVHYIFGNAIYSLRYPVVIWIVLVAVSLVSSYIVGFVYAPIRRLVRQERPVISR